MYDMSHIRIPTWEFQFLGAIVTPSPSVIAGGKVTFLTIWQLQFLRLTLQ